MRLALLLTFVLEEVIAFQISKPFHHPHVGYQLLPNAHWTRLVPLLKLSDEQRQDDDSNSQDFYPDLEFIDYSDPNYTIDQGMGYEFFDTTSNDSSKNDDTEAQIEAMREDRRRRNDEFQFETYFESIHKSGDEYYGEWTIYKTSTFLHGVADEETGYPRLVRAKRPLKVKSRAYKIKVETDSEFRVDGERICHEESLVATDEDENASQEVSAPLFCWYNNVCFDFSPALFVNHKGTRNCR